MAHNTTTHTYSASWKEGNKAKKREVKEQLELRIIQIVADNVSHTEHEKRKKPTNASNLQKKS